jgi:citrate lyase subunit beta/citryl-CoA lyase
MCATFLFLPSHERRKAVRAVAAGAHAVVFDLEAAVPTDHKAAGRRAIRDYVRTLKRSGGPEFWVRVNPNGDDLAADITELEWSQLDGAVVAQAEDPAVLMAYNSQERSVCCR